MHLHGPHMLNKIQVSDVTILCAYVTVLCAVEARSVSFIHP